MEWQPEKTAPVSVRVLVWSKREGVNIAQKISDVYRPQWWLCTDDVTIGEGQDGDPWEVYPTHWMPLPAPPA